MNRIRVIERSIQCYTAGWWSLLPIVGVGPAGVAIYLYYAVRSETGDGWNPARSHLQWGARLGVVGLLLSTAIVAMALAKRFSIP